MSNNLTAKQKADIKKAVKFIVSKYKDVLIKLGKG